MSGATDSADDTRSSGPQIAGWYADMPPPANDNAGRLASALRHPMAWVGIGLALAAVALGLDLAGLL